MKISLPYTAPLPQFNRILSTKGIKEGTLSWALQKQLNSQLRDKMAKKYCNLTRQTVLLIN